MTGPRRIDPTADGERLLELARREPPLQYDVERGLAHHHRVLLSKPGLPSWAAGDASLAGKAAGSWLVKCLLVLGLVGAGALGWQLRSSSRQPAQRNGGAQTAAPLPGEAPPGPVPPLMAAEPSPPPASEAETPGRSPEPPRMRRIASAKPAEPKRPAGEGVPAATQALERPAPLSPAPASAPDREEVLQLAAAERALANTPERALAIVRESERRFATGYLTEERGYVAIMALVALGRSEQARSEAARFLDRYPETPYRARVLQALSGRD